MATAHTATQSASRAATRSATRSAKAPGKQQKYRRRREEIIDAAAAVFAEKGYHGASTTDIADRLGIRQGSLYYYFASKETALEEVCYRGVEGFAQGLAAIVAGEASAADKLRAAVLNHLRPLLDRPDYVRVFLRDRHDLPDPSRRKIGRLSRRYERQIEEIFRAGIEGGEFRDDLDCRLAALGLLGALNGVAQWYRKEKAASIDGIADAYVALFVSGIGRKAGPVSGPGLDGK